MPDTDLPDTDVSLTSSGASRPVVPDLTQPQQRAILRAASELVASAVFGDLREIGDPTLDGAARLPVRGCFLTIRRAGRLRACCGAVGPPTPLRDALVEAAIATATRDVRMPRISPSELRRLELTVALLHSVRPVEARGEARRGQVVVGRHGLQIDRGPARGLLLPSVATENDFDAEHFLQQVCLKAGLSPTAWKADDAQLGTFEAVTVTGPLDDEVLASMGEPPPALLGPDDLRRLAAACRDNVLALRRGATPTYYLPDCPDGTVEGITLWLHLPGYHPAPRIGQLSIRPGLPLQATLVELAQMAVHMLARGGFGSEDLDALRVGMAVLDDPAMQGTVAAPDLEGLDPSSRAVLVIEQGKSAWVFDPHRTPRELVDAAGREARVVAPEVASVTSLRTVSTEVPAVVARVDQPREGDAVRPAAVAGLFYPGDPADLKRLVQGFFSDPPPAKRRCAAVMVPHAGLAYSGPIAAAVFERAVIPETVLVIGPKHTRMGVPWAVAPQETWSIPGQSVPSDPQLARALADAVPDVQLDAAAHAKEHAIEVELPLIAHAAPDARVVGLVIGGGDLDHCLKNAAALADWLRDRIDRTLLVISSDMNHFANDAETRRVDRMALDALATLDPEHVYRVVRGENISMCGLIPAVFVLETLRRLDRLNTCEQLGYGTSGDTTGDRNRVVGYAGLLFA